MNARAGAVRARLATAALLGVVAGAAAAAPAPRISTQEFAAGAEMSAPVLSPDGTHLAFVTEFKGEPFVAMYDIAARKASPILRASSDTFRVTHCDFKTDTRLLCHFRGTVHEFGSIAHPASRLVALDRDGRNARVLFRGFYGDSAGTTNTTYQDRIVHLLPDDPHHVLIEMAEAHKVFPAVYQLNVDDGSLHMLVPSQDPVLGWMADRDGVVRFGYGYRGTEALYVARSGATAPWRTLVKFRRFDHSQFEPLAFGPLPNQLFVAAPHQGRSAIWQMDLDENRDFQLVFSRPDVDVSTILTWPSDEHVVGFFYEDDRPHIEFLDRDARAIDKSIDQVLPDTFHRIISASRDGTVLLVRSYSDIVPATYHLVNTGNHTVLEIGRLSTALAHAQLAPMRSVLVPGPGGASIPGYLTLPVGSAEGTPIPAVVFPHGGPYSRDDWGYDPIVQLLANRGYAVLQLNYRGSTGYGGAWRRAGHQAWGTVMHADITAGAHWLVDQHIADPARLCIVGWSYGGYAALIGAVKEPRLYKCAVAIAGVSDVSQLALDSSWAYGGREGAEESTGTDKATLAAESPVLHADQIKIPVLLIHGEEDSTVLIGQSEAMAKALKRNNVPYEFVTIPNGEHSLIEPSMRLTVYSKLEEFLARNLGSQ